MKKILYVLLFFISSCLTNPNREVVELDVDLIVDFNSVFKNLSSRSYIYDLVDSVVIVKLETNEKSVLFDFDNFVIGNNYIYILDSYKNGSIAIFNKDGSFLKRISSGPGPDEINRPTDLTYDYHNDELLVYQYDGIKKYSSTGDFISQYFPKYIIHDLLPMHNGNGYIAVQNEGGNRNRLFTIFYVDSCFNIYRAVDLPLRTYMAVDPHFLTYAQDETINLSRFIDNDVYSINDSMIKVKRRVNFTDYKLELPIVEDIFDYQAYKSLMCDGKYLYTGGFCETNNYEFYSFMSKDKFRSIFYRNKNTGFIIGPIEISSKNSLLEASSIYAHAYGDFFISVEFHTDDLMQYEANSEVFSPEQMEILRNSKPDDNPLIILYRLKDIPADTE